jgi:excisionase family DNA binding protein
MGRHIVTMPTRQSMLGSMANESDLAAKIASRSTALTVDELAQILRVSNKTLYKSIKIGTLPALRVCGALRLDPKLTAEWLHYRTTGRIMIGRAA